MLSLRRAFFLALILLSTTGLQAKQPTEYSVNKQLEKLQSLSGPESAAATLQIATDIRSLPPGMEKVKTCGRADAHGNGRRP